MTRATEALAAPADGDVLARALRAMTAPLPALRTAHADGCVDGALVRARVDLATACLKAVLDAAAVGPADGETSGA
jgi:hypothetical protein